MGDLTASYIQTDSGILKASMLTGTRQRTRELYLVLTSTTQPRCTAMCRVC